MGGMPRERTQVLQKGQNKRIYSRALPWLILLSQKERPKHWKVAMAEPKDLQGPDRVTFLKDFDRNFDRESVPKDERPQTLGDVMVYVTKASGWLQFSIAVGAIAVLGYGVWASPVLTFPQIILVGIFAATMAANLAACVGSIRGRAGTKLDDYLDLRLAIRKEIEAIGSDVFLLALATMVAGTISNNNGLSVVAGGLVIGQLLWLLIRRRIH